MDENVIRIFVSAPDDVCPEREAVDRVVADLNAQFGGAPTLRTARWEESFFAAHPTFQAQVDDPADCDLVVALFWTRLGAELPPDFPTQPDGSKWPSGTVYELARALEASRASQGARPEVLVYRKTRAAPLPTDNMFERHKAMAEFDRFAAFWRKWFVTGQGQLKTAFKTFADPEPFEALLRDDLTDWLKARGRLRGEASWDIARRGSPFPGPQRFEAGRAQVFFGRDHAIERAWRALREAAARETPFLLVAGDDGTGKSSLARAGLLPRLTRPGVIAGVEMWRVAAFDLSAGAPFEQLAESVFAALPELAAGDFATARALAGHFACGGGPEAVFCALERAAAAVGENMGCERPAPARLALLADQMERLFLLPAAQRDTLAALIAALATSGAFVIATLRIDALGAFLAQEDFRPLAELGGRLDLAPPDPDEIGEMTRGPARAAGLVYERDSSGGLDDLIVAAARGADALPRLQSTLEALFRARDGNTLTMAAYAALGGLEGAAIDRQAAPPAPPPEEARTPPPVPAPKPAPVPVPERGEEIDPDSAGYLAPTARPARRRPIALIAATSVFALAAAIAGFKFLAADRERARAEAHLAAARATLDSVATHVAQRLRGAPGMTGEQLAAVLGDLRGPIDQWAQAAPDDVRLMQSRAAILSEIGQTQAKAGDLDGALKSFRDALALVERQGPVNADDPARRRDDFVARGRIGDVLLEQRDIGGALRAFRENLARSESASARAPGDPGLLQQIASDHRRIGKALEAQKDDDDALAEYRKSLAFAQEALALRPSDRGARADVSLAHSRIGWALQRKNDLPGALAAHRKALEADEADARANPGDPGAQRALFASHDAVGGVLAAQGDHAGARDAFARARDIAQKRAAADTLDMQWLRDIADSEMKIGDAAASAKDLDEAARAFGASAALREKIAAAEPTAAPRQSEFADALGKVAMVKELQGDRAGARAGYARSLTVYERLYASNLTDKDARENLADTLDMLADIAEESGDKAQATKYRERAAFVKAEK